MSREAILEQITGIFKEVLSDDSLVLSESSSADEVDAWDSFSHIKLVMEIEKMFAMKFSLGELQDLKNIKGLIDLVESKQ